MKYFHHIDSKRIESWLFDHFLNEFLNEYRGRAKEHNVKYIRISQFIKKHKFFSLGKDNGASYPKLKSLLMSSFNGKGLYSFNFYNQFQFHIVEYASLGENTLLIKLYLCEQKEDGKWNVRTVPYNSYFQQDPVTFRDIKLFKHKDDALMEGVKQLKKRLKVRDTLHNRQMNELHTLIQEKLNEWEIKLDEQSSITIEENVRKHLKTFVNESLQYVAT